MLASYNDFQKLEICVGRIIEASNYPEAKNPSFKLIIDFGDALGTRKSIAQLTANYTSDSLLGKLVICVVNFEPKQIGKAISEVLTLGVPDSHHQCVLLSPDKEIPLGGRLY